jgi:hypothetical protein
MKLMRDRKNGETVTVWFRDTTQDEKGKLGYCGDLIVFSKKRNSGVAIPLQQHITGNVFSMLGKNEGKQIIPDWLEAYAVSMTQRGVVLSVKQENGKYVTGKPVNHEVNGPTDSIYYPD